MTNPRIKLPKTAQAGEFVTVKTRINHQMENGHTRDGDGNIRPRAIIYRFAAKFNGQPVIDVALGPSVSTNPYFRFQAKIPESGTFHFVWFDDDGSIYETTRDITVV